VEQFLPSGALSSFVRQLFDGLVIGEQVKVTLRRVVADRQLEVPIRLHSSRCCCEETDSLYTLEPVMHLEPVMNVKFESLKISDLHGFALC
jgi:hypothetical protein